jgi:hypothetical protein
MHVNSQIKKTVTGIIIIVLSLSVRAQSKFYDTMAVLIIDRMTDNISDMKSCSFKLNVAEDVYDPSAGWIKKYTDYEVYISGPSKMLINARGYKGHRKLWYNGKELAYYFFDENNYGIIQMQGTTLNMIDSLHILYDIEFPAADFFYPSFTLDLFENTDTLKYLGIAKIINEEYFHILARSDEKAFQFWISSEGNTIPARFAITYNYKKGNPQYIASFSDWRINPHLSKSMFSFLPPPGSTRVKMLPKNER